MITLALTFFSNCLLANAIRWTLLKNLLLQEHSSLILVWLFCTSVPIRFVTILTSILIPYKASIIFIKHILKKKKSPLCPDWPLQGVLGQKRISLSKFVKDGILQANRAPEEDTMWAGLKVSLGPTTKHSSPDLLSISPRSKNLWGQMCFRNQKFLDFKKGN